MRDFKKEFVNDHKLLGDVRVLTTVMWPTQQSLSCELPRDLRDATGAYEAWYLAKHTGRKLTWQTALGTMLLQARFPKGSKLLSVSTLQGIILLLFNDVGGSLSVADLEAKTGLELTALSRSLQSLALGKHKVLIKSGADEDEVDLFPESRRAQRISPPFVSFFVSVSEVLLISLSSFFTHSLQRRQPLR